MSDAISARGLVLERLNAQPVLRRLEVAAPAVGEVRVRMVAAGLCHTDISTIRDARTTPVVLGHEGVGTVEAVGADVDGLEPGTRVLLCWKVPCGRCRRCSGGKPELCEDVVGLPEARVFDSAGEPIPPLLNTGCFCEFVVVPAEACIPVPAQLPSEQAALVGCAVATGVGAALWTAQVEAGSAVAVWGAGGVGLNVVVGAVLGGAAPIVAVDPNPAHRQLALARGATDACAPGEAEAVLDDATQGRGVDHAFEVVGDPGVMAQALGFLGVGGQLILIGAASRDALLSLHPRAFMSRQQRIVGCIYGSLRPHVDLPLLLDWAAQGRLPVDDLIGRRISLDELPAMLARPDTAGVRTVVHFT